MAHPLRKIRRLKLEVEFADGTVRVIEMAEDEPGYVHANISVNREPIELPPNALGWRVFEPSPEITLTVEATGRTVSLSS